MEILFLSADGWKPEKNEVDTVSLLIDGHVMVDTGWHAVHNLLRENVSIRDIDMMLLTHLHQDHRMGLPAMLFYLLNAYQDASSLSVYGVEGVERIVTMALEYAGKDQDYPEALAPEVNTLRAGDTLKSGKLFIETASSHHAVPGLMYRFTDSEGHILVYTGDTAPSAEAIEFARGADILIHEHSWGAVRPAENPNLAGHSGAVDAAICAREAGVKQLYLVHSSPAAIEESLEKARSIFPETYRAKAGNRIRL